MAKSGIQKHGTQTVQSLQVGQVTIADAPKLPAGEYDYVIFLVNGSNHVFVMGCYNFKPAGPNNFFPIPHTGRTCNSDCDTCHDNQNWQAIMNVDCRDSPIDLTIFTKPDGNGNAHGARWNPLGLDCNYSGGSICTG